MRSKHDTVIVVGHDVGSVCWSLKDQKNVVLVTPAEAKVQKLQVPGATMVIHPPPAVHVAKEIPLSGQERRRERRKKNKK